MQQRWRLRFIDMPDALLLEAHGSAVPSLRNQRKVLSELIVQRVATMVCVAIYLNG